MSNRKLSKAEKKAIIDRHPSTPASEMFTEEEWAELMFATHSEVNDIMRKVSKDKAKEGKGLLGMMKSTTQEKEQKKS